MKHLKLSLVLLLMICSPLAQSQERINTFHCKEFQLLFPRVRFEVDQRGGFGDVAAAYLTALALIEECPPQEKIQFVLDSPQTRISLNHLIQSRPDFENAVEILITERRGPPADLILYPASFQGDLLEEYPESDTMILRAPVFSDSESEHGHGKIYYKSIEVKTKVPGLGINQLGTYPDLIARSFRNLKFQEIRDKLITQAMDFDLLSLKYVLERESKFTLAYGVSGHQTGGDLFSYLKGLKSLAYEQPLIVLSPSRLLHAVERMSHSELKELGSLEKFHLNDLPLDWSPTPGRITLIETKNLPNSIFVGLMALSAANGVVPLGAGDGYLSSAIELGIPFGISQVRHNKLVIEDFTKHLFSWSKQNLSGPHKSSFNNVILNNFRTQNEHRLSHANLQKLVDFKDEFKKFSESIDVALMHWMGLAVTTKKNYEQIKREQRLVTDIQQDKEEYCGTFLL